MKRELPTGIKYLAEAIDKKGFTIKFGLEQQGHIETIEKTLDELGSNDYSWKKIGELIGWCPNAARDYYIVYLQNANEKLKK